MAQGFRRKTADSKPLGKSMYTQLFNRITRPIRGEQQHSRSRGNSHITLQASTESIACNTMRTPVGHGGGTETWRLGAIPTLARKDAATVDNTTIACCCFRPCLAPFHVPWGERRIWVGNPGDVVQASVLS